MDPNTGRVYDLSKDDIPDDVRERLVPIDEAAFQKQKEIEEQIQGLTSTHVIQDEAQQNLYVQEAAEELGEILDEMDRIVNMPDAPASKEEFHPINRAARRNFEKRNRALKKRKPNGGT